MKTFLFMAGLALAAGPLPRMPSDPPRTDLPRTNLRADSEAAIELRLKLPQGWRLHPEQKFMYRIAQTSGYVKLDPRNRKGLLAKPRFPIKIPFTPPQGESEVLLHVEFYYCPTKSLDDCKAFSRYFLFPISADAAEKSRQAALLVRPDQY